MHRNKILLLSAVLIFISTTATGCDSQRDFDNQVQEITARYQFHTAKWELQALGKEFVKLFTKQSRNTDNNTEVIAKFFANAKQIKDLESEMEPVKTGKREGSLASLEDELKKLKRENTELTSTVEKVLESQIREEFSRQGIFNPAYKYTRIEVGFPPLNIILAKPPHQLVISPRNKIETLKTLVLLPEMTREEMESLEAGIDSLGVSSLVVELGGISTYPSYVTDDADIRFVLDTASEEWLHQYLTFTPLGFRYILDLTGIRRDYDITTINETVASMVGKEIGGIIYNENYAPQGKGAIEQGEEEQGLDFNRAMREIRKAVDELLARGEIEQAERYMEQERQYLADNGYIIRKLNQAYFAFHGTYADSPTSISPIGAELKELRNRSITLKEFLETVISIKSRQELADMVIDTNKTP